mmetsp:Transcript_20320/g.19265  ORF Transcript_20320/g.19265 Transcript_20320/m.19265 type:complete len:87 (-) Transcript_20320:112-372(-)
MKEELKDIKEGPGTNRSMKNSISHASPNERKSKSKSRGSAHSSNKTLSEDPESIKYQVEASHTIKKMKSDPFKALGYGLNTYFDTL